MLRKHKKRKRAVGEQTGARDEISPASLLQHEDLSAVLGLLRDKT